VLAKAGDISHPGLSAAISRLTAPEDFAAFSQRLWSNENVRKNVKSAAAFRENFIEGVLEAVPGGARLIPQKDLIVQEQFQGNRYIGTGIALSIDVDKKYPRLETVFPGGPMERAGGRRGDLILKIGERDAHGVEMATIIDLLRGEEGTDIALVVRDASGTSRTISVTRGPVVFETIEGQRKADDDGHWDFQIDADSPIRCLKIVRVNGSTVHDLKKLENQLRRGGAKAVILDLRTVGQGELHHVVLLADALLDGGLIGRVRTQGDVHEFRADRERVFRDWPVVLLVDRQTGGAGEWIAAAVQDNHAGMVVGEGSAGMWQVSSTVPLSGINSALTLNTGVFERPNRDAKHREYIRNPRMFAAALPTHNNFGVTPDRFIAPSDRAPVTGPFAVLRKPVPTEPATEASPAIDPILNLALTILKDRINVRQTDVN
jgi:carboxyl-terminal processing protease